eukprot:CAMPEP_0184487856 /NCGR_PEP_ID=MMETSP0113_2-20130426/10377_1 /TAXON_ID=91329 /ORGANISM="Norrisiella sphaerica, Strain BC52" /LENGTH=210 /DNA_ID=CAMNT_0026870273 /DNA_START=296 /DNA_END=928 /DNA_ORIENTATION=+
MAVDPDECVADNPILELQEAVSRVVKECPWALEQTPDSIIKYLISEVAEVQEHLIGDHNGDQDPASSLSNTPATPPFLLSMDTLSESERMEREKIDEKLEDELGDLLMNVLFLTSIAKSRSSRSVSIHGAAKRAVEKLHRRCPYIFGAENVNSIEEARAVWQRVKKEEKEKEEREKDTGKISSRLKDSSLSSSSSSSSSSPPSIPPSSSS